MNQTNDYAITIHYFYGMHVA